MFPKMRLWTTFLLITLLFLVSCGQEAEEPAPTEASSAPALEPVTEPTTESVVEENSVAEPAAVTPESYPAPEQAVVVAEGYPAPEVAAADSAYPAAEGSDNTAASTRTFVIVPEESSASYVVVETFLEGAADRLGIDAGTVDTVGTTQDISGQMTLSFGETVSLVSGSFEVNISTLASDQNRRDSTIQDDFLESGRFPVATFTATSIENFPSPYREGSDVAFQLVGDLTIRETTQPVTLEVTASLADGTITASAVAPLTMSNFGVEPPAFAGILSVEDEFQVALDIVAVEQ